MAITAGYTFMDGEKILAKKLNLAIASGTITAYNGTVGATTPNTGAFTTLAASSTVSGAGFTAYLASPPSIGSTVAGAGSFTTINGAGLVDITASGGGQIKFPVIQNASANTNTLDDYVEGSWTPTVGGSATYTNQDGRYTKVGRLVTISGFLFINAIGSGSTSVISGLPYAPAINSGITVSFWLGLAASYVYVGGTTAAAASTITLNGATAAAASLTTPAAAMASGTILTFSGTYQV